MSKTKTDAQAPAAMDPTAIMAEVLQRMEKRERPPITLDSEEFQERLEREGFNKRFDPPLYQNFKLANARQASDETIERCKSLVPGKYLGGKVEVSIDAKGRVFLTYKYKTIEDRMRWNATVKSFDDLIDQIWQEMHPAPAVA